MASFICTNRHNDFPISGILVQVVIFNNVLGCRHFVPMVENTSWLINLFQHHCVRLDGFLFKVANKPMTELRVHKVGDEERVHENSLKTNDHSSFQKAWLPQVQEDNKMESLIISFLDQVVDPAIVSFHSSETSQMSAHPSNHTRNPSNSFQKKASGDPFRFSHLMRVVSGEVIV